MTATGGPPSLTTQRAAEVVTQVVTDLFATGAFPDGVPGQTVAAETARRFPQPEPIYVIVGFRKLKEFVVRCCPLVEVVSLGAGGMLLKPRDAAEPQPHALEAPATATKGAGAISTEVSSWVQRLLSRRIGDARPSRKLSDVLAEYADQEQRTPALCTELMAHAARQLAGVVATEGEPLPAALHALATQAWQAGDWCQAFELFLHALASGFSDGSVDPLVCIQAIAAQVRGPSAKDLAPEEMQSTLSPELAVAITLALGRAATLSSDLVTTIAGGKNGLYFALRDRLTKETFVELLPGEKVPSEYAIFEAFGESLRKRLADPLSAARRVAESGVVGLQADMAKLFLSLGRTKSLLLPEELQVWKDCQEVLAGAMRGIEAFTRQGLEPTAEDVSSFRDIVARLGEMESRAAGVSPLMNGTAALAAGHVGKLASNLLGDLSARFHPRLALREAMRRRPLGRIQEEITIPFEVMNVGTGDAYEVDCLFVADAPADLEMQGFQIGRLGSNHSVAKSLGLRTREALRRLRIAVTFSYRDALGEAHTNIDELIIDAQEGETNWNTLLERRPYTLDPVDRPDALWGRQAQIAQLTIDVATNTSAVIWGQKRVGKTSVARVLCHELGITGKYAILYLRKGDVAGFDEGQLGVEIAERLAALFERLQPLAVKPRVPTVGDFGGRLNRLTRFIDDLRESGVTAQIVVILDEFDEMNPNFYLGERGETFFGTLRALSERNITLMIVGSERTPAIMTRHSQSLNKYDTLRLDVILNRADAFQIIEEPVKGHIEYDLPAKARIYELASGNPYYINLVCGRILRAMINSRRTFVDHADVQSAAATLCMEQSPTHWSHLWADSESYSPEEREQFERNGICVLLPFARWPLEQGLGISDLRAAVARDDRRQRLMSLSVDRVVEILARRGVLQGEGGGSDVRYNLRPRLFRWWLCEGGAAQMEQRLTQTQMAAPTVFVPVAASQQEFPLTDEDLVALAEGMQYQGKPVDPLKMKIWLKQFGSRERILSAFQLLRGLRDRWYFDYTRVSLMLDAAYEKVVSRLSPLKAQIQIPSLQRMGDDSVRSQVFVSYLGGSLKSSADLARMFKKTRRIQNSGEIAVGVEWLYKQTSPSLLLVIDDFVGSGTQATGLARRAIRDAKERSLSIPHGRVIFVPMLAFQDGIDLFLEAVPEFSVDVVQTLDEADQAFQPEARIFGTEEERGFAERMCAEIGRELWPEHPLGWKGLQSLVVFPDSIPNATLPIFWKEGEVSGTRWQPLFPSR